MNICHLVLWILIFLFSVFLLQLTQKFFWFSITSFISVYSLSTLFTDTNFSRLIYVLIKALDVKTSIACNLAFASSIILFWFLFFFLMIDLYFAIPVVNAQIFNPTRTFKITYKNTTNDSRNKNKKILKTI